MYIIMYVCMYRIVQTSDGLELWQIHFQSFGMVKYWQITLHSLRQSSLTRILY